MPFLTQTQATLYYEIAGQENDGPWITMINGHTRSSRDFKIIAKALSAQGYRCLIFDNRGSGLSSYEGKLSWDQLLGDGFALWEACKITQTHLIGISMGGMICQALAAKYPERVKSLLLISTAATVEHLQSLDFAPWGNTLESVLARYAQYLTPSFLERNRPLVKAIAKQTLDAIENHGFLEKAQAQHDAIRTLDNRDILAQIKAPTLIIHGLDDAVIPAAAGRELAAAIPEAQIKLIPGAGHLLLAENGKGLGEDILNWVGQFP